MKFFPYKVTVRKPENSNESLQRNFSEMKFKLFYLISCEKNFSS